MAMSYQDQVDRINELLNQSNESAVAETQRVKTSTILKLIAEAQDVLCMIGKVWECHSYPTLTGGTPDSAVTQSTAYSTIEGWANAQANATIVDIIDVTDPNGVSFNWIPFSDRGKMYQLDSDDTMWWTTIADTLFLYPTPAATDVIHVYYHGRDTTTPSNEDPVTYPSLPDEYHYQLINYATFRGKQMYNQNQEASTYLSAFAQGVGLDLTELKAKIGAS